MSRRDSPEEPTACGLVPWKTFVLLSVEPPVDSVGLQHVLDVRAGLGDANALEENVRVIAWASSDPPRGKGTRVVGGQGKHDVSTEASELSSEKTGPDRKSTRLNSSH